MEQSEEILALKEAIALNRESLLNELLSSLNFEEINEELFQHLLEIISIRDKEIIKLNKALEAQEVINKVFKDGLI